MLNLSPSDRVFICSNPVDMRYSFDALAGIITTHFGMNPLGGHIFVFFSRSRDRMKLLSWELDGFALYYKRLDRGTFSWLSDLDLKNGGEMQASDFSAILAGINPVKTKKKRSKNFRKAPATPPLQLV